jgi:dolichol-phosphate mannosyltransferase
MDAASRELVIVVATYNEAENIPVLIEGIRRQDVPAHLLVVDDNSPDGTGDLVEQLGEQTPGCVHLLRRSGKLGYASAIRAGMHWGIEHGYRVIMTMDADLSHDPDRIPDLYRGTADYDVMIGSRYVPGGGTRNWPLSRRVLSRTASMLARLLAGLRAHDCTGGFRAYRAEIITRADMLHSRVEGYSFLVESLFKCQRAGAAIGETPIIFADRERGLSKISKKIILEAGFVLLGLGWRRLARRA